LQTAITATTTTRIRRRRRPEKRREEERRGEERNGPKIVYLFRFIDMDTRMNVYGQRGVLNLRPCIKMLQQNGRWSLGRHWRGQNKKQKVQHSNYNKRRLLNGNK